MLFYFIETRFVNQTNSLPILLLYLGTLLWEIYCLHCQELKLQMGHHAHPAFPWVSGNPNPSPHTGSVRTLRLHHSPAHGDVLLTLGTVNCPNHTLGFQTWSALISTQSTLLVPLYFVIIVYMFQDS